MVIEQYWALHDYGQKCVHLHEQLYSVRTTMQPLELQMKQCSKISLKIREFIDWVLCLITWLRFYISVVRKCLGVKAQSIPSCWIIHKSHSAERITKLHFAISTYYEDVISTKYEILADFYVCIAALFKWGVALQQRSRLRPSNSKEKVKLLQQAKRLYEDALHMDSSNLQVREALSTCVSELSFRYFQSVHNKTINSNCSASIFCLYYFFFPSFVPSPPLECKRHNAQPLPSFLNIKNNIVVIIRKKSFHLLLTIYALGQ